MINRVFIFILVIILGLSLVGCQAKTDYVNNINNTSLPVMTPENPNDNDSDFKQDLSSSIDRTKILQTTPDELLIKPSLKPLVSDTQDITKSSSDIILAQPHTEKVEIQNDVSTPIPLRPNEWIEPVFEIIRGELGTYFRIAIKNKAEYIGKNYEMKSECISHPFNEALKYQTDGKLITYNFTNWKPVDSIYFLTYLAKAEYALPENEKKYPIAVGMEILYEISIRKDNFIKKYPISIIVE